jgi:hypothetical protein
LLPAGDGPRISGEPDVMRIASGSMEGGTPGKSRLPGEEAFKTGELARAGAGAGASHPFRDSELAESRAGEDHPPRSVSTEAGASANGGGGIGGIGGMGAAPQSEPRAASSPGGAALDGLSLQLARGVTAICRRARAPAGPATTRTPPKEDARAVRPAETVPAR